MDEQEIEQAIQAAGKTAPRITPGHIDAMIVTEAYWRPAGTTVTVCCITLVNGFCVVGHSAAASLENFDQHIGEQLAREHARNRIWELEGYLLRQRLWAEAGSMRPFTDSPAS